LAVVGGVGRGKSEKMSLEIERWVFIPLRLVLISLMSAEACDELNVTVFSVVSL